MSDNTTLGDNAIPPKLNLKPQEANKHTTRIDLPTAQPEPPPTLKKKTSRIPLDQVSAESGAAAGAPVQGVGASKTIRISRPTGTPTITIAPSSKVLSGTMISDDAKRQTSRIPLELAISDGANTPSEGGAPKTIRIKRPTPTQSEPAPVAMPPPPQAVESVATPPPPAMSKTAQISLPDAALPETGQATQRKTIKIRRADGVGIDKAAPRSLAVARVEKVMADHVAADAAGEVPPPHPIFPVMAAAAVALLCVLVYVLFVQAFPSLGWPFPGKVTL